MKIKLDENISRHLKPILIREGYDVLTVADEGLLGKTDVEVGVAAKAEEMMLFTLDLEFADPALKSQVSVVRLKNLKRADSNHFLKFPCSVFHVFDNDPNLHDLFACRS